MGKLADQMAINADQLAINADVARIIRSFITSISVLDGKIEDLQKRIELLAVNSSTAPMPRQL